jgi:potassium-transporting ATPase potassium-binding subunit
MTADGWLTLIFFAILLAISTPLLGNYMAKVYGNKAAPGDRVFLPIERFVYRLCRIDPDSEQRWSTYVISLLAFTLFGILLTYVILRIQASLPGNPDKLPDVSPALAFNTAISFGTNTNWQNYTGEATMSQLSQMFGLVWHQFISAAVGMALAAAFIRALARRRRNTLGNFWVDTIRSTTRILIPITFVFAIFFMSQGVIDNLHASQAVHTLAAQTTGSKSETLQQSVPGGPVASMVPIEMLGDNGGGYFGANAAQPFENPTGLINVLLLWLTAMIPFAFAWTFGKMIGSMRQGKMVLAVMSIMFLISVLIAVPLEQRGNPNFRPTGVTQAATSNNPGGNLEGKDLRLGAVGSALNAADITATSTGGSASSLTSYTPLGGTIPLFNMMLGEVIPGGTGTGLFGMLIFVMITVFIAGLMVGRTPSYLGKQILAPDMKLVAIYILVLPTTVLILAGAAILLPAALKQVGAVPGPHGLTEVVYAYTSSAHNNGSDLGGLVGNVPWYNITLAIAMFFGRFFEIIPALALAGSLVRKRTYAATIGTVRTDTPLFTFMVIAVVFVLVGLTYFPALALGPLVEHLSGHYGI